MPTSDYRHIPEVLDEICNMIPLPSRVLEIGVGFGKWGVLLREILDARYGRVASKSWQANIYGIEIFAEYSNPVWDAYNLVGIGDVLQRSEYEGFDLVLMMDVLEHFDAIKGITFLDALVLRNRRVIVSVPNGRMDQGEVFGNPNEAHVATYYGPEFNRYKHKVLHRGLCHVVSIEGAQ